MNRHATRSLGAALLITTAGWGSALAAPADPAGSVALVTGQATASAVETMAMRTLQKGDAIYPGEIVSAGPNTYVNLKFSDGGFILLRPNSRFEIEDYAHPPPAPSAQAAAAPAAPTATAAPSAPAATPLPAARTATVSPSRAFFSLLKGGFRAVSGLIGKGDPDEYRINTPVATIGIRGTDYWVILCDEQCASDPVLLDNLAPGINPLGGIIVGVIQGNIFVLNNAGQGTTVGEGQFLITLPDGTQIYLPYEPQFLQFQPIPDPTTICAPE